MAFEYPPRATPLDHGETDGLKARSIETRGQLDHFEQLNLQEGLRWLSNTRKRDPLCETFVRELHKRMFGEVWMWAGSFRITEKNIDVDPTQISVEIRKLLDDARHWIDKNTYKSVEFAAYLHHRLVTVHPFPNGNGRHARIFTDTVRQWERGEHPVSWLGDEMQHAGAVRERYIRSLRMANAGDYSELIAFIAERV